MSKKEAVVEDAVEQVEETAVVEKFPLIHKGFGRFEVGGTVYPNKEDALKAQAQMIAQDEFENEYGDVMPEGVDIKITDRSLVFRGSLLEVPMNEVYLPDGSYNPMYSREWYYAWAARSQRSISSYEARGYVRMTHKELESLVDSGKAPAHYLSLLQRDGENLVYGDLILMRTPRIYWRQRKAQEAKGIEASIQRSLKDAEHFGDRHGLQGEEINLGL